MQDNVNEPSDVLDNSTSAQLAYNQSRRQTVKVQVKANKLIISIKLLPKA